MRHKSSRCITRSLYILGLCAVAMAMPTPAQPHGSAPGTQTSGSPSATEQKPKAEPPVAPDGAGKPQPPAQSETPPLESLDAMRPQFCAGTGLKSDAWLQLRECTPGGSRIIAWPLFFINANNASSPVPVENCLFDGNSFCGLDTPRKGWLLNPEQKSDHPPTPAMSVWLLKGLSGSTVYKSLGDEQDALLEILEDRLRLVELAWRMGKSGNPSDPIFTLRQGTSKKSSPKNIGSCLPVTVGEITVGNMEPWLLQSECNLPAASTLDVDKPQDSLLAKIAFSSAHPFKWSIKSQNDGTDLSTIEVHDNDVIHLRLFPYKLATFATANGHGAPSVTDHEGVTAPSGLGQESNTTQYLLALNIPLVATLPVNPELTDAQEKEKQAVIVRKAALWLLAAVLVLTLLGLCFVPSWRRWFALMWRKLFDRTLQKTAPAASSGQSAAASEIKGHSQKSKSDEVASRPTETVRLDTKAAENSTAYEDAIVDPTIKHIEAISLDTIREEVEREWDRLKSDQQTFIEKYLKELDRKSEQMVSRIAQDAKASIVITVKEELQRKFLELGGGTFPQLKANLVAELATIDKRIDRKMEALAIEWAQSLTDNLSVSPPTACEPKKKLRVLQVSGQDQKIMEAMQGLSELALELLTLWSRVQKNAVWEWQDSPLGKQILSDLRTLESIVFVDSPLWMWALGELRPSHLTDNLLRFGMNKWHVPESGEIDAAAVAKDWAQISAPALQNLIEGAPKYFGLNDPSGFRQAVISLAKRHTAMTKATALLEPTETMDDLYLNAASETFQSLIATLYSLLGGAQYFRMRVFRDTITSRDIPQVLDQSRAAYPFPLSRDLVANGIEDRHGLIVRIGRPYIKSGGSGWSGSLYYLEEAHHA